MRIRLVAGASVLAAVAGCASPRPGPWAERDAARVRADVASRGALGADAWWGGASCPWGALPAEPLTDEGALRIALARSPVVAEAFERLGIARARLLQEGLLPNPGLSLTAKAFPAGPEIEVGVVQALLELATRTQRLGEAGAERAATESEVVADVVGLLYEVRRALVGVRAAERLVEAHRENLAAAAASRELMDALHRAGNVTDDRRTAERIAESRAEIDLSAAEADATAARMRLLGLLGLPGARAEDLRVAGSLADDVPVPEAGSADRAEAASLALFRRRVAISRAARSRGIAVVERGFLLREVGAVVERDADGDWGAGPEFRLELPLFDTGRVRVAMAEGEVRRSMARYEIDRMRVRTTADVLSARAAELRRRVQILREKHLPQHARFVQEVLERHRAMQVGAFEVLLAKQQELDAQREYVETLHRAWTSHLDLAELLAGRLDPESPHESNDARPESRARKEEGHR